MIGGKEICNEAQKYVGLDSIPLQICGLLRVALVLPLKKRTKLRVMFLVVFKL